MKIAIIGPIARNAVEKFLPEMSGKDLPEGYYGHPFFGTLIGEFLRLGHKVVAITTTRCMDGNFDTQRFSSQNFEWLVVPSRPHALRNKWGKVGRMADFYSHERNQLSEAIKECKPDVVHAHWSYEFAAAAIASGLPKVVTVHDHHWKVVWFNKGIYWLLRALMAEWNFFRLKRVTTVSPYMVPFLRKKVKDVAIIPNPVTARLGFSGVQIAIAQKSKSSQEPVIIMINNGWSGRKNGKFGLEVFAQLLKMLPKASLHLMGHGSESHGEAYHDAEALGITNSVTFHGLVNHDRILPVLEMAHILIHTAKEESFGVVLAEAAISGTPAIGYYKAGAVPWVIGNPILLYNEWESEAVAKQIFELLKDPAAYSELAVSTYKSSEKRFSVNEVASLYLGEYELAIKMSRNVVF